MLHVFEVAGAGAAVDGTGSAMLRRGRLDHFGLAVPDVVALTEIWQRLVAVGASSGDIRSLGPMLSVRYLDPDGFEGEINCFNPDFDPSAMRDEDEIIDGRWLERTRHALHAGDGPAHQHEGATT